MGKKKDIEKKTSRRPKLPLHLLLVSSLVVVYTSTTNYVCTTTTTRLPIAIGTESKWLVPSSFVS